MDALTTKPEREMAINVLEAKRIAALRALNALYSEYSRELDAIKEDGAEAPDLVPFYGSIRKSLDQIGDAVKLLSKLSDHIKYVVIPETFDRDNIRNLTATNGDQVYLSTEVLASILMDNREKAYAWLRENNHGSIIIETINSSTLKSFAGSWMTETGRDFPPESGIQVEFRQRANFTAGKNSPNKL